VKVHRMGIVGTGTMGRGMMALFDAHPNFSVNAFYDASPDSLNKARETSPNAIAYQTFDEMISAQPLDCVYISSPPTSHLGYMQMCFDRHLPVFCEKPLSIDNAKADSVVTRAAHEKQIAAVNFPFASAPSLAYILNALYEEKSLGAIHTIEIHARFKIWPRPWQTNAKWLAYRKEGGFTREVLSHFLFAARRIVGTDFTLEKKNTSYPPDPLLCETHVEAVFMANEVPITVSIGVGGDLDDENRLTVTADIGTMRMRDWMLGDVLVNGTFQPMELEPVPETGTMGLQLDNLHNLIEGKPNSLATLEEAFHVQQHIEALLI